MSFFQNKPADPPSAFSTPQTTNISAFATPEAKLGPFALSGFGATPATGTSAFGQPPQQQTTGFGGFGGTQSTGAFGQQQQQQRQGGFLGQSMTQSGSSFGQTSGFGPAGGTAGFDSGLGQSKTGTGGFGGGFGQSTTGTGGFGGFGQQSTFGGSAGGGSFVNQQPQQQQQQGGFLGGGFGLQWQPQQGSAFTQPQQRSFGGGWLQAPQQQSQQVQLQAQPSITSITRWSDLPQNDQQALEALEKYIQSQNDLCEDLKTRSPQLEEYVASIPNDVAEIQKRFDAISHILTMDATTLNNDLRPKFDQLSSQTKEAIRLLEVLSHPSASSLSYLASTHGAGGDSLIDLFLNKTIEWETKSNSFKREINEIDRMLKAVEEGQLAGMPASSSEEIMETLRAQWDGFCGLTARVGKLRERAVEVKIVVERGLRGGRL